MKKMMRHFPQASAYINEKFILIITRHGCAGGGYDYNSPIYFFPPNTEDDESLGLALLASIQSSRPISLEEFPKVSAIKNGNQYDVFFAEVMDRFKYKTKHALFKNMKLVFISGIDENIKLSPSRHLKLQEWEGLGDESKYIIFPYSVSAPEAGAALRLAFEHCK